MRCTRCTAWKRSVSSGAVSSVNRLCGCRGQISTCPGNRGLRLTRAKECGVVRKTWAWLVCLFGREAMVDDDIHISIKIHLILIFFSHS